MTKPTFQQGRKAVVLLCDDSADVLELMRDAFSGSRLPINLLHVESGDLCLAFLRGQPPYESSPRPDLVLLDMHMPRLDGAEVLQAIRADDPLRSVPVIVLSTTTSQEEVARMYALGCNSFVPKMDLLRAGGRGIRQLVRYWFGLAVLPPR